MKRSCLIVTLIGIALFLALAACNRETPTVPTPLTEASTALQIASPPIMTVTTLPETAALPTAVLQPTLELAPTPIPTAYPVPGYPPIEGDCQYKFFFLPSPDSCPADFPRVSAAAEQPFEGGTMLWLGTDDLIVILFSDNSWRSVEDTWEEGQLESDPSVEPPAGRYQPIRGFGKVWREVNDIRQQLGWALNPELGFDTIIQEQESSEGIPETTFVRLFNEKVAALTQRDFNSGDWVIASSP